MDTSTIIATIALALNVIVLIAGAVWVVGKINATNERLTATLESLAKEVKRLHSWLDEVDKHGDEIDKRLTSVEKEIEVRKSKLFRQEQNG